MLSAKTSVSAGHSALQNSWYRELKKKDKALVDFVLIDFKNDTCDREEDFAAIWRKKHKKKTFGLMTTCMDYFPSSQQRFVYKMKLLFQHEFFIQNSDKVFSIGTVISQHSNRRFRHRTLQLHHQRRQLYKQEEEWFQNFSPVKKIMNMIDNTLIM